MVLLPAPAGPSMAMMIGFWPVVAIEPPAESISMADRAGSWLLADVRRR